MTALAVRLCHHVSCTGTCLVLALTVPSIPLEYLLSRSSLLISPSTNMAAAKRIYYFPSLYDKGAFNSPDSDFDIWNKPGMTFTDASDCRRGEVSRWPPGLADLSYLPIRFFSTQIREDLKPRTSPWDQLCKLEIEIKEIELMGITGDGVDVQKYYFLRAIRERMIYAIKVTEAQEKATQASLRGKQF